MKKKKKKDQNWGKMETYLLMYVAEPAAMEVDCGTNSRPVGSEKL